MAAASVANGKYFIAAFQRFTRQKEKSCVREMFVVSAVFVQAGVREGCIFLEILWKSCTYIGIPHKFEACNRQKIMLVPM